MSTEEEYLRQRREKLERLRSMGVDVYPRKFDYSHTITNIVDEFRETPAGELEVQRKRVRICGRIVAMRGHGKAGFLNLKQENAQIQIYVRKDVVGDQFAIYECLDFGDFLGVEGELFRTRCRKNGMDFTMWSSGTGSVIWT
jgi:lysyl-tRNA synthetase class 2